MKEEGAGNSLLQVKWQFLLPGVPEPLEAQPFAVMLCPRSVLIQIKNYRGVLERDVV